MNPIARWWNGITEKRLSSSDIFQLISAGNMSHAGPSVTEDSAMRSSAVYACIRIISESIASLPLVLYRQSGRNKERATNHPTYTVLHDLANPHMTAMEWRELTMAHALLRGNSWSEKILNERGQTVQLWPLNPAMMEGYEWRGGQLYWLYRNPDNRVQALNSDIIHHVKGLGDGWMGTSPIQQAAKQAVGLSLAAEEYGSRFYSNGARPGLILKHPGKLSAAAAERLKASFASEHQGLSNAHRTKILEEGMDVTTIGIPNNEAQFLECVAPGTLISMADGARIPVEDIRPGDEVIGWRDGPIRARVAAIGTPPKKPLVRLTTSRGRVLTATVDHPCLVKQTMRTLGGRMDEQPSGWVAAGQIEPGNYIRVGLGNVFDGRELDANIAWMLGALTGDGYLRSGGCSFCSNDAGTTQRMRDCLEAMGGGLKPSHSRKYDYEIKTGGKGRGGSPIRKLLNESGLINCGADSKRVPAMVLRGGANAWAAFLSGYLDADGSVNDGTGKGQHLVYWSSINRLLLEDCQHMLAMLGINSAIYLMSAAGKKEVKGYTSDAQAQWGLYVTGASQLSALASILKPAHSGKGQKLARLVGLTESRYRSENWLYDRIDTVELLPEGDTIGIEIDGIHTHITSGLVTHNTRKFQVTEIARIYRVPPHMLADLDRATFSNIEQQSINFVIYTLMPWLVRHEQAIYRDLLSAAERRNIFAKYIVEGMLRGDALSRYQSYQLAINNTILTPNEIRELEDRNPVEGGDVLFTPLNMIELGKEPPAPAPAQPPTQAAQEEPEPRHDHGAMQLRGEVSDPAGWSVREERIRRDRQALMTRNVRLWQDAAERMIKREVADVRRAANRYLGKRSADQFRGWLETFYDGMRGWLPEYFRALLLTYAETVFASIAAEMDTDPATLDDDKRAWIEAYLVNFANSYTVGSEKQLRSLLAEAEDDDEAARAVEDRLDGWLETQPSKTGLQQSFEAGNALAILAYSVAGVEFLRWSARGESCPLCKKLDGRRIPIGGSFVDAGDTVKADGVDPLPVIRKIRHGPLHAGCDCTAVRG